MSFISCPLRRCRKDNNTAIFSYLAFQHTSAGEDLPLEGGQSAWIEEWISAQLFNISFFWRFSQL